jgi:hypothetical protein
MQDIGAFGAGLKDLAALPVNALAGLVNTLNTPINKGEAFRRGAAGAEPGAMSQNQRAVASLGLLPGYAAGRLASAAIPAATAASPLARGLMNIGRAGAVGAAESAPASLAQVAMGDNAGAVGGLALGGTLGAGIKSAGMGLRGLGKTTGNVAESMTGIPASDLRKIGFLGNSEYGQKVLAVAENRRQHLNDLGDAFLDRVRNFDQYLPNAGEIDQIVESLPPIEGKRIIEAFEKAKPKIKATPESAAAIAKIDELQNIVANISKAPKKRITSPEERDAANAQASEIQKWFVSSNKSKPKIGETVRFIRFGKPVEKSTNFVTGEAEKGMSVYSIGENGASNQTIRSEFSDRGAYIGTGKVIGFGSDGEPLVENAKNITKATPEEIDKAMYYGVGKRKWEDYLGYPEKGDERVFFPRDPRGEGKIPAAMVRKIRQEYDQVIGDAFGKESSAYVNALKNGRHEIAKALEEAATESGKPEYAAAMKDYTTKLGALDDVMRKLGGDKKTQEDRIEGYLSNLFQGNKTNQQEAFKRLSDIMGADFAEKAQLLSDAKRIAPTGTIPLISAHKTGKAGLGGGVLGVGYGVASGNPVLAGTSLLGAALGSPALSPGLISVADRVSSMAARPMAGRLARTAGRTGRALLQAETTER